VRLHIYFLRSIFKPARNLKSSVSAPLFFTVNIAYTVYRLHLYYHARMVAQQNEYNLTKLICGLQNFN